MKQLITILFACITLNASAKEGMWLPFLLENNIADMQDFGLRLSADDIYNINQACIKDAIVGFVHNDSPFWHFCSGSVISAQGLVVTNHHCGLDAIRANSTQHHNYLADGFWASNYDEELPAEGIGICFLRRMEDVTSRALKGVTKQMDSQTRKSIISENINQIVAEAERGTTYKANVDGFYEDTEFYLSVYEIFTDVRIVAAPPMSIGNFGGETDNWMWPRHTGDFCMFRIYANTQNQPAKYSPNNKPYKPITHLKISTKGVSENDFAMVMGYPAVTNEYLPAFQLQAIEQKIDPLVIDARTQLLNIMRSEMEADETVFLKYASKRSHMSNGWKKKIGERRGLQTLNIVNQRAHSDSLLNAWILSTDSLKPYKNLMATYQRLYNIRLDYQLALTLISESLLAAEPIYLAEKFLALDAFDKQSDAKKIARTINSLKNDADEMFADYDQSLDQQLTLTALRFYLQHTNSISQELKKFDAKQLDKMYASSIFTDSYRMASFLNSYTPKMNKKLEKDPFYAIAKECNSMVQQLKIYHQTDNAIDSLQQLYLMLQRQFDTTRVFFPDANSTFRVSYGKVLGYTPNDGVSYSYFTTLDGVMEKVGQGSHDYMVPQKLRSLYNSRNYGQYAMSDGRLPVCFISTNHTSGGNSGSASLNANGELIGLNFDRAWDGIVSDMQYNPNICRNITVDIRYVLFLIEKLGEATWLIDEMDFAK